VLTFSLQVKDNKKGFEGEKTKVERKMNSMRLGNYLRKLMLKNNNLIDNKIIFLETNDFGVNNDDINYADMNLEGDNDNDFKARLYALKWAKLNFPKLNYKPLSVNGDTNEKIKDWNILLVLLLGDNNNNKVIKVCFPSNLEENFAIITSFNKVCKNKIKKINEYNLFDNYKAKKEENEKEDKEDYHEKEENAKETNKYFKNADNDSILLEKSSNNIKKVDAQFKKIIKKVKKTVKKEQSKNLKINKIQVSNENVEDLNLSSSENK